MAELAERGVEAIDDPVQALDGHRKVVIRSHGVSQSVYDTITGLGLEYADATCPFVARIHRIVAEDLGEEGLVIIAGDASHPEVQAIKRPLRRGLRSGGKRRGDGSFRRKNTPIYLKIAWFWLRKLLST